MPHMSFLDLLLGKPLASGEARAECIGVAAGIPIFGLDALSSAAYGPEAALTLLIPLGAAGIAYVVPISASILILLAIVYFSYRQTIQAYPGGGGSYTVARQNLGVTAGLLAAAALMIDYVLTVAVGISAGVGALVSVAPSLQSHTLSICLGILVLITLINLRGMRDTGLVFMAPTYLFAGTLLAAILIGLFKTFLSGGHPVPVEPLPPISRAAALPSTWSILQAFASHSRTQARLYARHPGSRGCRRTAARRVWRHNRSLDSPLRRGSISRFHAFAGRNGWPLAPRRRQRRNGKHAGQWFRRVSHRNHRDCRSRGKICRRRLDHGAADSRITHRHGSCAPPLSRRFPGSSQPNATRDGRCGATARDFAVSELESHCQESPALRS